MECNDLEWDATPQPPDQCNYFAHFAHSILILCIESLVLLQSCRQTRTEDTPGSGPGTRLEIKAEGHSSALCLVYANEIRIAE